MTMRPIMPLMHTIAILEFGEYFWIELPTNLLPEEPRLQLNPNLLIGNPFDPLIHQLPDHNPIHLLLLQHPIDLPHLNPRPQLVMVFLLLAQG